MSDLAFAPLPGREEVRAGLRQAATRLDPPLRVLAEDLRGEQTTIDLLAVDTHGRVVLLLVCSAGEDAATFTRALAHREWVRARVGDWMKLAPSLALRSDAEVRVLLLAPTFAPETLAAGRSEAGRGIELARLRSVSDGARRFVLVDPIEPTSAAPSPATAAGESAFRTGLTERELGLDPDDLRELQ